jgi:hypothetical protein
MHPCATLEQRWSACRARGYGTPWFGDWEPSKSCVLGWRHEQKQTHRRLCTSPRRHQCRSGGVRSWCWTHYAGHQERCQHPADDPFDDPQVARWLADAR